MGRQVRTLKRVAGEKGSDGAERRSHAGARVGRLHPAASRSGSPGRPVRAQPRKRVALQRGALTLSSLGGRHTDHTSVTPGTTSLRTTPLLAPHAPETSPHLHSFTDDVFFQMSQYHDAKATDAIGRSNRLYGSTVLATLRPPKSPHLHCFTDEVSFQMFRDHNGAAVDAIETWERC